MSIVLRSTKGSRLTSTEVDGNFSTVLSLAHGRNRIMNAACRVQQRPQVAVGGVNTYGTADRFFSAIGGGAGGASVLGVSSFTVPSGQTKTCLGLIATTPPSTVAAGSWWYGFNQVIEGYNAYDLLGQQVAISFWWQSNVTGNFPFSIRDNGSTRSFVTAFNYTTANVPQYITIIVPAIPLAAVIPISNDVGLQVSVGSINTGTYQCPSGSLGAWQSANYISAQGGVNWATAANNFIRMSELQVEKGDTVTPFEARAYPLELLMCQYYYYRVSGGQSAGLFIGSGFAYSTTNLNCWHKAPTRMRTTPQFNASNLAALAPNGSSVNANSFAVYSGGPDGVLVNYTMASAAWTAGQSANFIVGSSAAAGFIELNADF